MFFVEGIHLLSQWLTGFELFGIPYLVGKIKFKTLFFRVHWLSEFTNVPKNVL